MTAGIWTTHQAPAPIIPTSRSTDTFKEHRHDQAILSCLCKVADIVPIADETFFAPDWSIGGADLPIWAARHHWGSRFRPVEPPSLSHRAEWCLDRAEQWWAAHTREG